MVWAKFGATTGKPAEQTGEPTKIYVASSWRNPLQQSLVQVLRFAGFDVYDFKNPPATTGFHWSDVGLQRDNDTCSAQDYLAAMQHPRSIKGFDSDFQAMQASDVIVLLLPCGRSAHLELGWAVGAGKKTAVLLDDPCTPELMYRMVDLVTDNAGDLLFWLGVED